MDAQIATLCSQGGSTYHIITVPNRQLKTFCSGFLPQKDTMLRPLVAFDYTLQIVLLIVFQAAYIHFQTGTQTKKEGVLWVMQ